LLGPVGAADAGDALHRSEAPPRLAPDHRYDVWRALGRDVRHGHLLPAARVLTPADSQTFGIRVARITADIGMSQAASRLSLRATMHSASTGKLSTCGSACSCPITAQ